MKWTTRLDRLTARIASRPPPTLLHLVTLCPLADAGRRGVGLYRHGPPGSLAGVYVYDPAVDPDPTVPPHLVAPFALVIGGEARPLRAGFNKGCPSPSGLVGRRTAGRRA